VSYHVASRLVKAAARPPVLLDGSMTSGAGGAVRDTVRQMRSARKRVAEVIGFVPSRDLAGVSRVIVEAGREAPALEGEELLVGPKVGVEETLRLFGGKAYESLDEPESGRWLDVFQRETNAGKRVVTASGASAKFVEAYVDFHLRPRKLRGESPLMYGFFERVYGKRTDQLWDIVGR